MTAKEMFANLGYQLIVDTYYAIDYVKTEDCENPCYIVFERDTWGLRFKKFFKDAYDTEVSLGISIDEFKCIETQLEDLGVIHN